jgi:HD-GYP domain-containing protein (c-di-GMP phosphodiesterase class II)
MFGGDLLTSALELGPMTGAPPRQVIRSTLRSAGTVEAVLYAIGIFGALAALAHAWTALTLVLPAGAVYVAFKRNREMHDSTRMLLVSLADTVDLRDPYTGGHSRRVTDFCAGILRELGLEGPDVAMIIASARVHDIGKIGIPDAVLQKPGALTPEEWAIMQSHAERGAELLARYPDFARGVEIVRHHHERWDGKGYPTGLKEYAIPFGARVIAVADSFDAMTSDRPYRPGMSDRQAARILLDGRGTQWDARVVDAFLSSIADRLAGRDEAALAGSPSQSSMRIRQRIGYGS